MMMIKLRRLRSWPTRLALGLVVAAFAAPGAQAAIPSAPSEPTGSGVSAGEWEAPGWAAIYNVAPGIAYVPALPADLRYPGEGITPGAVSPTPSTTVRPDDRPGPRPAPTVARDTEAPQPVAASEPSFNWTDAGIGAAIVVGGALLLAAGISAMRRRRPLAHS
jgi:hypothetical protein